MEDSICCLVDDAGAVYEEDGPTSNLDVCTHFGRDERAFRQYRFDLVDRRLFTDRGSPVSDRAAHDYINGRVGTPEKLMRLAEWGRLPKRVLMNLLTIDRRAAFLEVCGAIEAKYTDDCAARNDPCLESGCALEGEVCLQPLLRAEVDYRKACAAEWIKVFANPRNRVDAWRK